MAIEKVLEFGFNLIKKDPKVVLPGVLNLVTLALLSLIVLQGANEINGLIGAQSIEQILSNGVLLGEIFQTILNYAAVVIPVLIVSSFISLILICIYSDVVRQAYSKKRVMLAQAFSVAKSRFLSLLWTYFIEALIAILVSVGLFGLGLVGGAMGVIPAFLAVVVVIMLALVFFYETPAVVVLENRNGLGAIKRSYDIARRNFWSLSAVILIFGIINGAISSGLNSIPYIGFILSSIAGLFLGTWGTMIPATFYYEYGKKDLS